MRILWGIVSGVVAYLVFFTLLTPLVWIGVVVKEEINLLAAALTFLTILMLIEAFYNERLKAIEKKLGIENEVE